ncbi:Hypothetical predicted protein [Octopus vulgaris]|uniref:Uncharacterized protein n=1 Tax=Octopus vulgaris TaxID=6645 RepID=A0AA36B1A2_OCTVU|nr:Hypothetical predicted protein [Octopus vulgaris]
MVFFSELVEYKGETVAIFELHLDISWCRKTFPNLSLNAKSDIWDLLLKQSCHTLSLSNLALRMVVCANMQLFIDGIISMNFRLLGAGNLK